MKKKLTAVLAAASLLFAMTALAEEAALPGSKPETAATPAAQAVAAEPAAEAETLDSDVPDLEVTTKSRWFVNRYKRTYTRKISYYANVYAYNHGE